MVDINRQLFQRLGKVVTVDDLLRDCRDLYDIVKQQNAEIESLKKEIKKES